MGYENKIPNIGKTVQSVRDTDFISITEVKAFDKLIDDIVSKLSVISNDNSSITDVNETLNIAQEIKKIEFNMADAINPDGSLNISSTPDPVTGEVGGPVYGEYSMDKMLIKLDNLYNRFTKLVGEHGTEWKIDLDNYYNSVYNDFKNTVNSIFGNSVNNEAIEGKENSKYDYTKRSAVKLESNEIMRLNPDVTAYPRTVNVLLSKPNTDTIAFEVTELESKNFVMNMRFFNGSNYFSYNVIIDNDELFITKEESFKYNNFTYTIKIFKYEIDNSNKYIVTLSSDCNDITVKYSFRIEGLLVGTYDFSTSGFNLSDHKNKWNYEIIDKNVLTVPEYNVDYWYKEEIPVSDISETSSDSFNWKSVTGLRSWDDKEYYIRKENFTEIGKIEINSEKDLGTVNLDNKDISGKDVTNESYPTIVNKKKYTKPLYYTHVDMDTSEIFENNGSRENFIKNNDFYHLDEGAKFIHTSGRYTYEKRDGKRNIDGNLILASGNNIISLGKIKPKTYIEFNDNKDNSITNNLFTSIDDRALYIDFTNNSDGHLVEAALKNAYGENNVIVPVILDFVDFFINKLTISSNGCHLYNENLQEVINNSSDIIIDGISLFVDTNDVVYVMPKYNRIIYGENGELIRDISILISFRVNDRSIYYKGITNNLIPLNYKLINFVDSDNSYNNLDLNKYRLVVESEYSKLLDLETESKGIKDLILKYDELNKVFVKDPNLSDLFIKTPYTDCISNIDVKECNENKSLIEFVIAVDNNREQDAYKFIYNNNENEIEFPNIMNRKDFASSKEIPMKFISTASDEHLIYSIDGNGELYYSIDGSSWKKESRVDYNKFRDFGYIEYDKQSLWFALCYSVETGRNELVYSQNGYDWNLVERGSIIGTDENILKFKNVAINRYFLGTNKYAYFSEDGINWIKTNIPTGEWRDCAWNTKKFVVVGSIGAYQVLDGMDINIIANGFTLCTGSDGDWNNVATYDDYCFVICGKSGAMYSNSNYLEETDTISFTRNNDIGFVGSSRGELVNGKIFVGNFSRDNNGGFIDEHNVFQFSSNGPSTHYQESVAYSPDLKLYVSATTNDGLWYSYDGRFWIQSNITSGNSGSVYWDESLKLFISGSDGKFVYSTDGKTWTDSNITAASKTITIYKFKEYICIGTTKSGDYYSTDGKTWTRGSITSSERIPRFASNDKTLVAIGNPGIYYTTSSPGSWVKCTAGNNIAFDSLIYDPTYKKFYATGSSINDIYISSDGINWSTVTTSGPKGNIASNGKIILAFPDVYNLPAQGEYSIDGGQTWSTIKGLPSNISTWWIAYNEISDIWYSCYNISDASPKYGIVYSRNGIDWNLLFEPTPTSFTGETKLISTHAEDDTSEYPLGYFFIINGKDIHRSRDGRYWQKISYDSNITSLSAVGNVTNRDAFLCLENKGILVSTRNDEALNGKFSTYGEYFRPTSITEGTYGDIVQTTNSDINNTAYIAQSSNSNTPSIRINESKNSYLPITFKTGDKISFIGDIGDNELIVADNVEYLNYDRYDRAFTPNVAVGNRNINFIKRITDKTTILGLDTSLIFTDESNNDVYTKSDISVSDIVVTTNGIYGLNNGTGMFEITNPDSNSPTFTEVFSDLSTYNIRNIFEYSNRDLLFIAYKDSKYTIFRKKYSETTIESLGEFAGSIQFIDLIDDKLIMLAHGLNNGTEVNYVQNIFFDNKTNSIVTQELIDAEKILNFDKVIKYKGELFVFNKLEENENIISMNFGKLILNGDGTLVLKNSDNGIITYQKNQFTDNNYPTWNGFVYNDKLYFYNYHGELLPTEEDPNAEPIKTLFKGFYTIEDTETANGWNIIPVDNLLSKTLDLLFTDELIVQDSLDNSLIIHDENDDNYKLDFDSDSKLYKNDKIYFDKETKGLVLGKYHSNGIFNLYTEMLTAVKSETGDNINIALALGQDAKVALYDKDYDFLKVLDFKYVADRNGSGVPYYLNISDSEEAVITNIYSGTKASENWLYFVVKDKFSTVLHDDYGNFSVSSSSSVSLRLFKVSISSIKTELNSNNEKITCEWISDITGLDNIDNINIAFSRDGIIKTDPLTIENYNGLQYIISGKNLRYPNVDSIASFNVNTDCLIITSKIIWDSKFIDIIDQTEDINNELNYTKAVICSYDYNKAGKLDDNRAVSSFLLLNTETNGTIEHAYVTGKPNNTPINIGKRVFNTCKSGFKYTTTAKNTDVSTRYPNSYVGSDSTGLESSFVPSKIVKTDVGGLVLDTVSTSGINNGGYLVNKYNESVTLDKFSDGNKFYYNDAKNTEIGLFRWFNSSINSYKPSEFADNSDAKNTGWLYFTPKNSGKIVRFDLGPNDYVYNVYETYAGVFISVRETMRYGTSEINNFELYRLINIPNTTEIVQMGDTRYFQKCNCGNDPVIDLRDTSEGIFMIAFYSTRTRVFRWNGEDFYMIKMDLNYTTGIKRIFDTSVGVFFMGNKAEWGLLKYIPSLDKLVHTKYKVYLNNWMSTSNIDTIETERGIYVTGTKTGTTDNKVIWDLKIDKCKELGNIGDIGLPKEVNVYPYTEDEFFAYNNYFKKLSEKISDSYNLPMDTWVKTIGNIDINGIEVPIKGMKLVSGEGVGNNEPDNVIFSIDQNARFNGITSELIDLPKDGNISGTIVQ